MTEVRIAALTNSFFSSTDRNSFPPALNPGTTFLSEGILLDAINGELPFKFGDDVEGGNPFVSSAGNALFAFDGVRDGFAVWGDAGGNGFSLLS